MSKKRLFDVKEHLRYRKLRQTKANISTNYISKQAKDKIEKIGGKLTLVKN